MRKLLQYWRSRKVLAVLAWAGVATVILALVVTLLWARYLSGLMWGGRSPSHAEQMTFDWLFGFAVIAGPWGALAAMAGFSGLSLIRINEYESPTPQLSSGEHTLVTIARWGGGGCLLASFVLLLIVSAMTVAGFVAGAQEAVSDDLFSFYLHLYWIGPALGLVGTLIIVETRRYLLAD